MADTPPEPHVLLADCDYASDHIRKIIEVRDLLPVIPMHKLESYVWPLTSGFIGCAILSSGASTS